MNISISTIVGRLKMQQKTSCQLGYIHWSNKVVHERNAKQSNEVNHLCNNCKKTLFKIEC